MADNFQILSRECSWCGTIATPENTDGWMFFDDTIPGSTEVKHSALCFKCIKKIEILNDKFANKIGPNQG